MNNFTNNFWQGHYEQALKDPKHHPVINGVKYYIDPDESDAAGFKGFGGRKFKIRFNDGTEVTTRNLWHNGEVPDEWRDKLPDTAEFVK